MRSRNIARIAAGLVCAATACKDTVLSIVEVASVQVTGLGGPVLVGASVQLQARPLDDRGNTLRNRTITWSSSNTNVVQVDANGRVTGVGAGAATVTATAEGASGGASVDVHNPSPAVTAINPAIPIVGSASFQLTVTGTGFVQSSVVRWNGTARTTTYVSATELRAAISATDVANTGSAQITVFNPAPGGGASTPLTVTIGFAAPVVQSINPPADTMRAAGFQLTVTGTGFSSTSVVRWNGSDRTTTFVNATTLRASILAGDLVTPGYAQVTVFTPPPGGGTSSAQIFTVRVITATSRIAAGNNHTCAVVTQTGRILCWGRNESGQLGDAGFNDRTTPVQLPGTIPYVAVVAGASHTCALDEVGNAWCWGANFRGQLGDASTAARNTQTAVSGNRRFIALEAGGNTTCGIEVGGAAYCWGENNSGQLGDGSGVNRDTPTPVQGGRLYQSIGLGTQHACAVTTAGTAFCWGHGLSGQLGQGTNASSLSPVPVQGGTLFQSVDVGTGFSCARTAAGVTSCWGQGAGLNSNVPVAVTGGQSFTFLRSGINHICGATSAGAPFCWGGNSDAQLGNGQFLFQSTSPGQVSGLAAVRDIAAGERHTCAVTTVGELYCWGNKDRGQLGAGVIAIRSAPVQVQQGATGFSSITVGAEFSCGVRTNARIACWGAGFDGQLGNGAFNSYSAVPADVSSALAFAEVRAGFGFACALTTTGAAHCWGNNGSGQLGNGTFNRSATPVAVSGGQTFRSIDTGGSHTCGITTANQILCWGSSNDGQLGTGNNNAAATPAPAAGVAGISFTQISTGVNHACALTSNATVYCWGWNFYGTVGDGTTANRFSPALVPSLTNVVSVEAGYFHTCALTAAGVIFCWGFNGVGEFGVNPSGTQASPVQMQSTLIHRQITAGIQNTCSVDTSNVARCWGLNATGQFGDGNVTGGSVTPRPVNGGLSFARVETNLYHSCGLTTGGNVYCWGFGRVGEWGNGEIGLELTPRRVTGVTLGPQQSTATGARPRRR